MSKHRKAGEMYSSVSQSEEVLMSGDGSGPQYSVYDQGSSGGAHQTLQSSGTQQVCAPNPKCENKDPYHKCCQTHVRATHCPQHYGPDPYRHYYNQQARATRIPQHYTDPPKKPEDSVTRQPQHYTDPPKKLEDSRQKQQSSASVQGATCSYPRGG